MTDFSVIIRVYNFCGEWTIFFHFHSNDIMESKHDSKMKMISTAQKYFVKFDCLHFSFYILL